jgi:hypothetical protein
MGIPTEISEEQKETIYQMFFGARTYGIESQSNKQYDNSIGVIAREVGLTPFVVSSFVDKCIRMRKHLAIPIDEEISKDKKTIVLTFKSRMNYEI